MDNFLKFKKEVKKMIKDKTLIKKDKEVEGLYNIYFNIIPVAYNENTEIIKQLLKKYNFEIVANNLVHNALRDGKYLNNVIIFKECKNLEQDELADIKQEYENFIENQEDCILPLQEAKKLKAYEERNDDDENNFADIYYHILHEVNLYEEGEDCNVLNTSDYNKAKKWLAKYNHLYEKYEYR
nr:MAG TPA: hypothetical protein [Caudoviricetes sp.]